MRRYLAAFVALAVTFAACAEEADDDVSASGEVSTTTTAEAADTTAAPETTTTTAPPQPAVYEGQGTQTFDVEVPGGRAGIATITHAGTSNFVVWNLDADLAQIDLLVNTIGNYSGTVGVDFEDTTTTGLQIEADGTWRVEIKPLNQARRFDTDASGQGDDVLIYDGESQVVAVSHQGQSNFAVHYIDQDGLPNLMVNEIGNYSATMPLTAGPGVLKITADGAWSIRPA